MRHRIPEATLAAKFGSLNKLFAEQERVEAAGEMLSPGKRTRMRNPIAEIRHLEHVLY